MGSAASGHRGRCAPAVSEGDSMTHDVNAGVGNIRSRRLLLLERTMYREGRTPVTSVFSIQLLGRLEEGRLRQALGRLKATNAPVSVMIEEGAASPREWVVLQVGHGT